jgi:hypothetical protein
MVKMRHHTRGFENGIFVAMPPYKAIKYFGCGQARKHAPSGIYAPLAHCPQEAGR